MNKLEDLRIDLPPARIRRRAYFPWLPVVLIIFCTVVLGYLFRDSLVQGESVPAVAANPATASTAPPAVATGPPGSITAAGYLEVIPPGPVLVSTLVAGRVAEVLVVPGDSVNAGDVLARLDTAVLEQELRLIRSRIELAESRLAEVRAGFRGEEVDRGAAEVSGARAALELAQAELDRAQRLFADGIIAGSELDTRRAECRQAESRLAELEARLAMLEAGSRPEELGSAQAAVDAVRTELAAKQWELDQCTISAPATGVVYDLHVQPGAWVVPSTDNPVAAAVASLFDPTAIQAWVDVNQRDSRSVQPGRRVELTTDSLPGRPVPGVVSAIMPRANLQKNTVQAKISITEVPADFRPELSVTVTFLPDEGDTGSPGENGDG